MPDQKHTAIIERIAASLDADTLELNVRESSTVEFKENFNWGGRSGYAKTMAAFANARGGYLIFGVADKPRKLVGLPNDSFDNLDEQTITEFLNGLFSPEIHYEKLSVDVAGHKLGLLWTDACGEPPVMPIKNSGDVKEAEIYYRYNARNDKIKYPELKAMLEREKERERAAWKDLFSRVSKLGPEAAGIMDINKGTIDGRGGNLLIEEALIPKLKFIREGHLQDKGEPTLKLVGDVRPLNTKSDLRSTAVRITDDPTAPVMREETLLDQYPLDFAGLLKAARRRYSDFKQNADFNRIMTRIKGDAKLCHTRYGDPRRRKMGKNFYAREALDELDKAYTLSAAKLL